MEKHRNNWPNYFIVGAARSGTTSLSRYLSQHPQIYIPFLKEVHFFAADYFPCHGPGDEGLSGVVIHDEEQYVQLFAGVKDEKAIGESSVFYLCLPGTAERIERAVPGAKIIMILREPVERAYSAYMHLVRDGREHLSFAEGLELEKERRAKGFEPLWWYKELSLYHKQVRHYLDVFGRERVKVLLYDELCANPGEVLRDIFVFLGVNEDAAIDVSVRYNVSGVPKSRQFYTRLDKFVRHPSALENSIKSLVPWRLRQAWVNKAMAMSLRSVPLDPELREELRAYFAEDVEKLAELLGRDLSCWGYKAPYAMQLL